MVLVLVAAILVPTTLAASRGDRTFSTRNTYNDHRAPRPVNSLGVASSDVASVTLDWSRTWDNVGVEGYGVYLDGTRTSETEATRYTFDDLVCGRGYTMGVDAFDDAGNRSRTTSTFASTAACRDTTAPTAPADVRTTAATDTQVILSWSPSTDDFGVTGYSLYVGGFWVGRWSQPSATITNLKCGQTYEIGIDASDAAGNQSERTQTFFSTASCGDRTPPSTPSAVVVAKTTQDTVTLGWSPSTDASGVAEYGLYRDGSKVGTTTTPNGAFAGLSCGKTYTLGVDAADTAQNRSSVASVSAATAPCNPTTPPGNSAPSAPPNLHATSTTQTSVALAWDSSTASNGMAGYQVFRDGTKIGEGPGVHGGYTNEWVDDGRACGTSYEYAVAGVDSKGTVGSKSTVKVATGACASTPPPPPPPPPTKPTPTGPTPPADLRTTSVTQTAVKLAWGDSTAAGGMSGYQVLRDGTKIGEGPGTLGGYTNTWNDSGRKCGTKYTYSVAGVDKAGAVGSPATLSVTTATCDQSAPPPPPSSPPPPPANTNDTTAPSKPLNVSASTRTATSIALTWQPSTDDVAVTGYGVYRGGSRVATPTAAAWIFSGLTCNTSYTLAVDAVDAAGNRSQQATVMVSTTGCADTQAPTAATGLKASNVTGTGATLSWSPSSDNVGVGGYDVLRNGTKVTSVSATSAALSGLSCATAYTFGVVAYDAAGNRAPTAQLVTTTAACAAAPTPPPPPPTTPGLIELSGNVSGSTVEQEIASAPSGAVTIRPAKGATVTVSGDVGLSRPSVTLDGMTFTGVVNFNPGSTGSRLSNSKAMGFNIFGADNIVLDGNSFDGRGVDNQNVIWDQPAGSTPDGWRITNNSFSNFYRDDGSHSEALYVGYSTNGLIQGNTFTNNGNTSHVFFTWFGTMASASTSYPRSMCVKDNTFNATHGAYFDVNLREEIPTSSGIKVQPDASITNSAFSGSC
jgi:chitodextrinase